MKFSDVAAGKYSLQQIFDHVASNLLRQGEVCAGDDGSCRFRSDGGRKRCAVGWIISDEEYSQIFPTGDEDGEGIDRLINQGRLPCPLPDQGVLRLLRDLQDMHDNWYHKSYLKTKRWTRDLYRVALRHGLKFSYGAS